MSTQPPVSEQRMVLADVDVPFGRLVVFFIKVGLAAIPAAIILWLIMWVIAIAFGMMFGFGRWMHRPF